MSSHQGAPMEDQIKKILEKNLAYSREIYRLTKQIKRYIFWGKVMSFIGIAIVALAYIGAIVFLPEIINNSMKSLIPGLSEESGGLSGILNDQNINQEDLIKNIQQNGGIIESYKKVLDLNK